MVGPYVRFNVIVGSKESVAVGIYTSRLGGCGRGWGYGVVVRTRACHPESLGL